MGFSKRHSVSLHPASSGHDERVSPKPGLCLQALGRAAALVVCACILLFAAACGSGSTAGAGGGAAAESISGTIQGAVADGVTVSLAGAATRSTVTAGGGTFSFTGLGDGSYTVTPSLAGYAFTPASHAVTLQGQSQTGLAFTAAAVQGGYSISGTLGGTLVAGVRVVLGGDASGTVVTDGTGDFLFSGLLPGTYTVSPQAEGGTFTPASSPVTIQNANHSGLTFSSATDAVTFFSVGGRPEQIVAGLDGNLWYADSTANAIVKMTPGGVTTAYSIPTPNSGVWGLAAVQGGIAFTERNANKVGVMQFNGSLLGEWQVPTANAQPMGITVGADGALYFVESHQPGQSQMDKVGRVTSWGTPGDPGFGITDYALQIGGRTPTCIASAGVSDPTRVWLTEALYGEVATFRTSLHASGVGAGMTYGLSAQQSSSNGIVAGPGNAMWFTESSGNAVGTITLSGGTVTEYYSVPTLNAQPLGIAVGPDGNLWFTESAKGKLGILDPTHGSITERSLTSSSAPAWIAQGADGNLWVTLQLPGQIARVVP